MKQISDRSGIAEPFKRLPWLYRTSLVEGSHTAGPETQGDWYEAWVEIGESGPRCKSRCTKRDADRKPCGRCTVLDGALSRFGGTPAPLHALWTGRCDVSSAAIIYRRVGQNRGHSYFTLEFTLVPGGMAEVALTPVNRP
jgi:hypothetical protein